jgi:hypothetical protein
VIPRSIAALLIIARPLQCLYFSINNMTRKKPLLKAKMLYWHWLASTKCVACKEPSSSNWEKNLCGGKLPCLFVMYTSALYLLRNFAFHLLGDRVSMHPHKAEWTKTGKCYGKARHTKVLYASPCINNGHHRCGLYYWLARCFSRASHRYSSYNFFCSLTFLTYAYWMMMLLESSTCPMCMPIPICRNRQFNSCMFMIISWCGCWAIKAFVEAEVLWWLYCDS